jgi:hypothetical protein
LLRLIAPALAGFFRVFKAGIPVVARCVCFRQSADRILSRSFGDSRRQLDDSSDGIGLSSPFGHQLYRQFKRVYRRHWRILRVCRHDNERQRNCE